MNYGELSTEFIGLLKRRDVTTSQANAWLQAAIARAQSLLRVPAMEKSIQVTVTADEYEDGLVPLPSDYLAIKEVTVDNQEIGARNLSTVLIERGRDGTRFGPPKCYTRRGSDWWFGPIPETGAVIRVDYYAELPALSASTDTNWLSVIKPYCIIHGALSFACRYFMDKRRDGYEADFLTDIGELQAQADMDELSDQAATPYIVYPEDC